MRAGFPALLSLTLALCAVLVAQEGAGESSDLTEIRDLEERLQSVLKKTANSKTTISRVVEIIDKIEEWGKSGDVEAQTAVVASADLNANLLKRLLELKIEAEDISIEVDSTLVPKIQGFVQRLRTKAEFETNDDIRKQYIELIAIQEERLVELAGQKQALETNVENLSEVIEYVSSQVDYLSHAKISVELTGKLVDELKEYNKNLRELVRKFFPEP